jgi:hypothetical protein
VATPEEAAAQQVKTVQAMGRRDRARALASLNASFRAGAPPAQPMNGRYRGQLMALDIAPGVTRAVELVADRWMPWQGKQFDAASQTGDNIFSKGSRPLIRILWPFYKGIVKDTDRTYRAFTFRTYVAPGLVDADRQVLKLDYDIPGNPKRTIRRVLDEVVEIGEGVYLGKAYTHWWWGKWQLVAYFSLSKQG